VDNGHEAVGRTQVDPHDHFFLLQTPGRYIDPDLSHPVDLMKWQK
jgi:hypothetical protein